MSHLEAPEYQGVGGTQLHDAAIEAGLVERPAIQLTDDEQQLQFQEQLQGIHSQQREEMNLEQLEEAEDELEEEILQRLKQQRLREIKQQQQQQQQKHQKSQPLMEISESQFQSDVLEASYQGFCLLLLYKLDCSKCEFLTSLLELVSASHPELRFSRLLATGDNISNFPLSHCPAVLAYHKGRKFHQWSSINAWNGFNTNQQFIERELKRLGIISQNQSNEEIEEEEEMRKKKMNQRLTKLRKTDRQKQTISHRSAQAVDSDDEDEQL